MMLRFAAVCVGLSFVVLLPGSVRTDESAPAEEVPAVTGLPAAKAKATLQGAGFAAKFNLGKSAPSSDKELTVYEQSPQPGEFTAHGQTIELKLYAKRSASVVVPGLIGQTPKAAKAALLAAGLVAKFGIGSVGRPRERQNVYAQDPAPGSMLAPGSAVQVTIHATNDAAILPTAVKRVPKYNGPELLGVMVRSGDGRRESIDPISGELSVTATDLQLEAGPVRLDVIRAFQQHPVIAGLCGSHWRMNWERRLIRNGRLVALLGLNQTEIFEPDVSSRLDRTIEHFRSPGGHFLAIQTDRATWTAPNGVTETYDGQGRLLTRSDTNGSTVTLRYDHAGNLARVDGPFHTFLQFTTDSTGCVMRIESSNGDSVQYVYGDRPRSVPPSDAAQLVSYAYDSSGALARINDPRRGEIRFDYDRQGRVTRHQVLDQGEERFEYDDAKRTRRTVDARGAVTTIRLLARERQIEVTDPLGAVSTVEFDAFSRPAAVKGPTNVEAHFQYDALGRTTRMDDSAHGTVRYEYLGETELPTAITTSDQRLSLEYDARHNLVQMTSNKDKTQDAKFEYNAQGQLTRLSRGDGETQFFTYDDSGRPASVTDVLGNKWRFEYDRRGNLLCTIDPLGGITARSYDAEDRVTRITDAAGGTTRIEYTRQGRQLELTVTDPRGSVSRSVRDSQGRLLSVTGPGDRALRFNYDLLGNLTSVNDSGRSYRFEYDAEGNLLREANPLGGVTTRSYDALGRLTSIADPTGATTLYEYSTAGLVSRSIDPTGNPIEYKHDSRGRLSAAIDEAQRKTALEYGVSGRLSRVVPPSGSAVELLYNAKGRVAVVKTGRQELASYEYDALGRRIKERFPTGFEVSYRYDALGQIVGWADNLGAGGNLERDGAGRPFSFTDLSGGTSRAKYDAAGNLVEGINALGRGKRFAYDEAGRLNEVVEANGDKARYEYTATGQVAVVHRPGGRENTYDYNTIGQLTRATDPSGGETVSVYDSAGRLLSATDAKKQTTTFRYDPAGRLTEKRLAEGTVVKYRYDDHGRIAAVDDGAFPIRYAHDADGQVTRIEYPALKRTLRYEYNPAGRVTKFVDSEGRSVQYEYDPFDRLIALKDADQTVRFAYDASNRLTALDYPNGIKGERRYDAARRLTELTYRNAERKIVAGWKYAYDLDGNRAQTTTANGETVHYRYDAAGQLLEEDRGDVNTVSYTYLPGGNRATRRQHGQTTSYEYDKADRLLKAGAEAFSSDANGNLVARRGPEGTTRYVYNSADQLTRVVLPDGSDVSFGYAATGERIWRRDSNGLTWFVTDGTNVTAELDEKLVAKATYLQAPELDTPLVVARRGQSSCYHTDALGSVTAVTDKLGRVTMECRYDAFGIPQGKTAADPDAIRFTGREYDAAAHCYYFRAREYDPTTGRMLQRDPAPGKLSTPATFNPYLYVLNNPLRYSDPTGAEGEEVGPQGFAEHLANTIDNGAANAGKQLGGGDEGSVTGWAGSFLGRFGSSMYTSPVLRIGSEAGEAASQFSQGHYGSAIFHSGLEVVNDLPALRVLGGAVSKLVPGLAGKLSSVPGKIVTAQDNADKIRRSGRIWGQANGMVFGTPRDAGGGWLTTLMNTRQPRPNDVIFEFRGQAASLFKPHDVGGLFTAVKWAGRQHTAGFGDLKIVKSFWEGERIVISKAKLLPGQFAGQSSAMAWAKWIGTRYFLDPLANQVGISVAKGDGQQQEDNPPRRIPRPVPLPTPGSPSTKEKESPGVPTDQPPKSTDNGGTNSGTSDNSNSNTNSGTNNGANGGTNSNSNQGTNSGNNSGTAESPPTTPPGPVTTSDGSTSDPNSGTNSGANTNNNSNDGTGANTNNNTNSGTNSKSNQGTNSGNNSGTAESPPTTPPGPATPLDGSTSNPNSGTNNGANTNNNTNDGTGANTNNNTNSNSNQGTNSGNNGGTVEPPPPTPPGPATPSDGSTSNPNSGTNNGANTNNNSNSGTTSGTNSGTSSNSNQGTNSGNNNGTAEPPPAAPPGPVTPSDGSTSNPNSGTNSGTTSGTNSNSNQGTNSGNSGETKAGTNSGTTPTPAAPPNGSTPEDGSSGGTSSEGDSLWKRHNGEFNKMQEASDKRNKDAESSSGGPPPKADRASNPTTPVLFVQSAPRHSRPAKSSVWDAIRKVVKDDCEGKISHRKGQTQGHRVPKPENAAPPDDECFQRRAEQIVAEQRQDAADRQKAVSIDQQLTEEAQRRRQAEADEYNRQVAEYNRQQSQYQYSYSNGGGGHQGGSVNYGAVIRGIGNLFGGHGGGGHMQHNR
jgi:RHS repeat-associated protein